MFKTTVTLRGGRFLVGPALRTAVQPILEPALQQAGGLVLGGVRAASPVRSGALQKGWRLGSVVWDGWRIGIDLTTAIRYARAQNLRPRHAGYIERGIATARPAAQSVILAVLRDLARAGWG